MTYELGSRRRKSLKPSGLAALNDALCFKRSV